MALYVANAIPGRGPLYDIRPVEHAPARRGGRGLFAPALFLKDMAQGACAGLLTLLGAMHFSEGLAATNGAAALAADAGFSAKMDALIERLLQGGGSGVIEIVGAMALFLSAGRGPARMLGLLGFVAITIAYANGVSEAEFAGLIEGLYERLKGLLAQLQASAGAQGA
ncbi:MAG: hypothetical protein Kow00133_04900 [Amphiplicatus sp.]